MKNVNTTLTIKEINLMTQQLVVLQKPTQAEKDNRPLTTKETFRDLKNIDSYKKGQESLCKLSDKIIKNNMKLKIMKERAKTRIQLSDFELKTLIHHLSMEMDSIKDVYEDLVSQGDQEDAHRTYLELETAGNLKEKITRALNNLT